MHVARLRSLHCTPPLHLLCGSLRAPCQVSKGAVATMYGTSKMLPAEDMEGLLARYIDLLYKVKPAIGDARQ
jgi:hypothetical protein